MIRRRRGLNLIAGLAVGLLLGVTLKLCLRRSSSSAEGACVAPAGPPLNHASLVDLAPGEDIHNSNRTLVFVGVMTAEQYLGTRARAVRDTWGRDLPGRYAMFSSAVSRAPDVPLVALKGVDDSYPPQKKSFMMLLYMYEHYGDKFEWFMRADDDVYVRGDKLEEFLRSVDSRKPQFIGQAGRGTGEERDALSLDYDENFCMGGPGVLLSRETLRRVAPHVRYCLKNLYTTHEDVELGRCVAKFAGVSCTWSYDMQTILHHNSSGSAAYTGRLKRREVHRAITLHPVKDFKHMYRIHSYFKNYRIRELREQSLELHRDISSAAGELRVSPAEVGSYRLAEDVPLFPAPPATLGYLGDNTILGVQPGLNRFKPDRIEDILTWDYISKSIYSYHHSNPKRRIETLVKEALDDVIREVMQLINAASRQRGRVIDFNEILYGYTRLDPLHGADHVLDILLKYRRYRGRKMTASVRRHAYLQQSFTGMEIRELSMGEPSPLDDQLLLEKMGKSVGIDYQGNYQEYDASSQQQNQMAFINLKKLNIPIKEALETGLMKLQENLPNILQWSDDDVKEYSVYNREIKFILPLSGRLEVFVRFMKNYEDIVLKSDEVVSLIVVLYVNENSPQEFEHTQTLVNYYKQKYSSKTINIVNMGQSSFSRGHAITEGLKTCSGDDLTFFIDVDMMFNFETLRRIRVNTIKHTQVYFPIVFSEYNPAVIGGEDYNKFKSDILVTDTDLGKYADLQEGGGKSHREIANIKYSKQVNDDLGYFRQYGFGILSAFKCDVESVGGFNLTIKGWGMEDVQLFETMIKSNLNVFRMADDSLVHIFHAVDCDKNLEKSQYLMCLGTKGSTYGSDKHMTYYMLNHPHILWPPDRKRGVS